jgi:hypothetical protein
MMAQQSCSWFCGLDSFFDTWQVFYREKLNGYYGVTVFILSNYLSSFPFLVSIALLSGTICFYLVKFRSGFNHYVFFCLNIFGSISVIESLMMVIASLVPNFLMGLITGAGIIVRLKCFRSSLSLIVSMFTIWFIRPHASFGYSCRESWWWPLVSSDCCLIFQNHSGATQFRISIMEPGEFR